MTPSLPNPKRRNTLGDISTLYVSVLLRAVQAEGQDASLLQQQFGLGDTLMTSADARISIPRYMRLGHAAIELTGNPALGLTMGAMTRAVDAGNAGFAAMTAATTGQALATLIRFSLLNSRNSRGHPSMDLADARAQFYSIRPYNAFNYFVVDSVLASWTQLLRELSGQRRVLERVTIEYPSQGLESTFETWFDCPVLFGASENALQLAPGISALRSLQAQPATHRQRIAECEQSLKRIREGWSIKDRVKEKLPPLLESAPPTLGAIAAELGLTPWTLQRQLAEQHSGYRELLDETRRELALDYIRETHLSLAEIAWLLGFSGPAAFHKAYRRWFNTPPGEHRRAVRQTGSE
ncbi:AraC family transcriptional regulator [Marinobacter sp. SS21]|uniref:AraC family transcriptional regulator n=1 Tax=Marinobacter sp. SS21 TaxID=2979460 RepID=UPI002330212A|nr:AraC family transcriptional regulator [Marinobacter sp. SS21]MDC0663784.1 AraC family transcriptional regulator [Marinobacter sp. SS21]